MPHGTGVVSCLRDLGPFGGLGARQSRPASTSRRTTNSTAASPAAAAASSRRRPSRRRRPARAAARPPRTPSGRPSHLAAPGRLPAGQAPPDRPRAARRSRAGGALPPTPATGRCRRAGRRRAGPERHRDDAGHHRQPDDGAAAASRRDEQPTERVGQQVEAVDACREHDDDQPHRDGLERLHGRHPRRGSADAVSGGGEAVRRLAVVVAEAITLSGGTRNTWAPPSPLPPELESSWNSPSRTSKRQSSPAGGSAGGGGGAGDQPGVAPGPVCEHEEPGAHEHA